MFNHKDLALRLKEYFAGFGYSPRIKDGNNRCDVEPFQGFFVSLSVAGNSDSLVVIVDLESHFLDNRYRDILSNLDSFYRKLNPEERKGYEQTKRRIKSSELLSCERSFSWVCHISDCSSSDAFMTVYDSCIRPAVYIHWENRDGSR